MKSDDGLRSYQREILTRAAELRAIAAEMDLDVGRVVERSRESERLGREVHGLRSTERADEPGHNRLGQH